MQAVEFSAADDWPLHGRLYGDPARCHAALLVVPAMGVAQRYYADFAEWLASHGWAVLSFDYRGIGASRPAAMQRSLRGLDADVTTWAEPGRLFQRALDRGDQQVVGPRVAEVAAPALADRRARGGNDVGFLHLSAHRELLVWTPSPACGRGLG